MRLAVICLLLTAGAVPPASAQQTRTELVQQQRAEKAGQLRGYARTRVEAVLFEIEDRRWIERLFNPPRGIFARSGGLPERAGLGAGPAVRFSNHAVSLTGSSVITTRKYWELDARLAFPRLADRHAFAELGGRRHAFPQENFYGLGPDSDRRARTSYALRETSVDAVAGVTPTTWLSVAGSVERLSPRVGRGRAANLPSIEAFFSDAAAPGLRIQPDFIRVGTSVRVNYLDAPFATNLGGLYTVSYDRYSDRDGTRQSFDRWNLDLQQFVPIVNNARSLALHARFANVTPDAGHEVPFYLQPTLGGGFSLRGLRTYRLRDRSLLLLQAEYRWLMNPFISGAIFYDAGTVAPRPRDLELDDLTQDFGIGVRLGWMTTAAVRADLAFGSGEGPRLVFKFSNVF